MLEKVLLFQSRSLLAFRGVFQTLKSKIFTVGVVLVPLEILENMTLLKFFTSSKPDLLILEMVNANLLL